ncbi:MAG: transcriptional regulator [Gammaproteobacteria bacterium]|nr:transcriptional regulator [Gammaproteobacteria bacterium]
MAAKSQRISRKDSPRGAVSKPRLAAGDHGKSLDRLIHEKSRLAIVSALAANKYLTFNDLKSLLNISDGNLSAHSRKLEEAGYLNCSKDFEGRKPRTRYSLSAAGRRALQKYINHMEALISSMKNC